MLNINKRKAAKLFDKAKKANDDITAEKLYKKSLEFDNTRADTWYNLGLLYKYQNKWQESFEANLQSHNLDPEDEAACWNLGIAATGLKDWKYARQAWKDYGIDLNDGEGEIEMDFGMTPIRLKNSEVVWCRRIDPARAAIRNIPLADSINDYDDIILHDGAPNGERIYEGKTYDVFDELEMWKKSDYKTYKITISTNGISDYTELEKIAYKYTNIEIEDWTKSVRYLCKKCSEGTPHEDHYHDNNNDEWQAVREVAITCLKEEIIDEILNEWSLSKDSIREIIQKEKIKR